MTAKETKTIEYDPIYDPFNPELIADPYPYYARLRDEHPVYYNERLDCYVLSRYDDIYRALRKPQIFSSAQGLTPEKDEISKLGIPPTFIMMDPPDHTRLRRLITKAFTPDTVKALEPKIRAFVVERIEAMKAKAANGETIDLIPEIASPLPTMVVADILGVPPEDREKFDPWSDAITSASADFTLDVEKAIGAVQGLVTYFGGMCQARRADPTDDMITKLTQAEVDGDTLTDWDILGFCFVMIAGGNDTTSNFIGNSTEQLDKHPDQRREMIDNPTCIPNATEELLRIESVVQGLSRTTTQNVEYYGTTIPAGSKVHNLYASGNRDPRHWGDDADELDIHREIDKHLSFAQGPHFCIGAHVARLMIRIYFEEMGARIGESYDVDWDNAERRKSGFTRGYTKLPIRIKP
ncbi:MAG: cytochrome P450 [Myxococcales bacterium]|nr:cytochrome P450 [Myxococcales bacterium]MDH3844006.1 cytochrome P450 [Myxococcales bacterium]